MNITTLIILVAIGGVCAYIHKSKGYSPIAGFVWGFFFSIIGLAIVLLEKDKEEHDRQMQEGDGLSLAQWIGIFVGIGVVLMIIAFIIITKF